MRLPRALALRDLGLVAATLGLWRLDAVLRGTPGSLPIVVAVLAGGLAGVAGYLAHEWGHLAGAWATGSVVQVSERPTALFLFRFDSERNTRRQFLGMSCGGFAASAGVVALFVATLPFGALSGRLAALLTGLGVLAAAVLELPVAWRVARGAPLPRRRRLRLRSPRILLSGTVGGILVRRASRGPAEASIRSSERIDPCRPPKRWCARGPAGEPQALRAAGLAPGP
jgi:hypothetical protein